MPQIETLASLHRSGIKTTDLIAAVQREGVYALDIHAQWGYRKPDSREANKAQDWLLKHHYFEINPDKSPSNPEYKPYAVEFASPMTLAAHYETDWESNIYESFGWPKDQLPDFSDASTTPKKRKADNTRVTDSYLLIIAALAQEVGIDIRKPSATNQLIQLLEGSGFGTLSDNKMRVIVYSAIAALDRRST